MTNGAGKPHEPKPTPEPKKGPNAKPKKSAEQTAQASSGEATAHKNTR